MEQYNAILRGHYELPAMKKLHDHFKQLVRCPDDQPHVDIDAQPTTALVTALMGRPVGDHIQITGSVAQNLKCESPNKKGDIDFMFLSNLPTIAIAEQRHVLEAGELSWGNKRNIYTGQTLSDTRRFELIPVA